MAGTDKLVSLAEALEGVEDGMQVATGGWIFSSQPVGLARELVRRRVRDLHLIPAPGSIAPDLLIGGGCVKRLSVVFLSFEQYGLAPHFRRMAEAGELEILEMDGPGIAGGLRAGATDLPFMLVPDLGTDLPRVNPQTYQPFPSAPGERKLLKVPSVQPDYVLLHGQRGDELGNVQLTGPVFFDPLLAQAGKKVVVSVDEIVSTEEIRRTAHLTKLPAAFVDKIVELPFGAHPSSSADRYKPDDAHIKAYVGASRTAEDFAAYLDTYVYAPIDNAAYLTACGLA